MISIYFDNVLDLILFRCVHLVVSVRIDAVQSIEELVNGFRYQQMMLSSTMLNESQNLGLPEKLAAAEVEEAEERTSTGKFMFSGKTQTRLGIFMHFRTFTVASVDVTKQQVKLA